MTPIRNGTGIGQLLGSWLGARAAVVYDRCSMNGTRVRDTEPIPVPDLSQDRVRTVCVVGAGAIGSLIAAHLSRVVRVVVLTRRDEQAAALAEHGLRVSGLREFTAGLEATSSPAALAAFELGIVTTKATDVSEAAQALRGHSEEAVIVTIQNGLGAEELVRQHGPWPIVAGTTLMGGTRHSDTHVEFELDAPTWLGPYEGTRHEQVESVVSLFQSAGLKAEGFSDLAPARWSKLVFNASVGTISALTELPHSAPFAEHEGVGGLVRAVVSEGSTVATAAGIQLAEDPWELNVRAVDDDYAHPPSILLDVWARRKTEVDFNIGAIVREADRLDVAVPLSRALYGLLKAKESSYT